LAIDGVAVCDKQAIKPELARGQEARNRTSLRPPIRTAGIAEKPAILR
jgi:hypothetical protein